MTTWLLTFAALGSEPVDVRVEVASDVFVNWTELTVEMASSARGGGTESTRAVEELARRGADAGIRQGVGRVPVTSERTVGDLQQVPEFQGALDARIGRWRADQTVYQRSGQVVVHAELSLVDLLKPYSLATAHEPAQSPREPDYTGVVIDARGTGLTPCWSPRVLSHREDVLYDGRLLESVAVDEAPVVYVSDPAHLGAARAGDKPIFLTAGEARGADLVLTPEDSQRFRTSLSGARLLGEGTVVVVVDP